MLLGKRLQHLLRGPTFPSTLTDKSYSVAEVEFAKKRQLTEPGLCRKVAFCRCKWPRAFAWARSEFVYSFLVVSYCRPSLPALSSARLYVPLHRCICEHVF